MQLLSRNNFSERSRAWLTLIGPDSAAGFRLVEFAGDRVVIAESADFEDDAGFDEVLLVRGNLRCGARCQFQQPVFVGGDAEIGRGSQMDSVIANRAVVLGPDVVVDRWAESGTLLDLRARARAGEAIGGATVQLGLEAIAGTVTAPEVATHGRSLSMPEPLPLTSYLEFPKPSTGRTPDLSVVRGWRPERLGTLGADTWVYDGHLHLPMPLLLRAKLVVSGSLWCPPGSLIEDDVKTGGSLHVGAGSLCRGLLTSLADLNLDEDCIFTGNLQAAREIRLCSGVRGFRDRGPVNVAAGGRLILEPDVVVRGGLQSAACSIAVRQAETSSALDLLLAQG